MKKMLEDDRTIEGLYFDDEEGSCFVVGHGDVTTIEAYGEPGVYGDIPYFAVFERNKITHRVPAYKVTVKYAVD